MRAALDELGALPKGPEGDLALREFAAFVFNPFLVLIYAARVY